MRSSNNKVLLLGSAALISVLVPGLALASGTGSDDLGLGDLLSG